MQRQAKLVHHKGKFPIEEDPYFENGSFEMIHYIHTLPVDAIVLNRSWHVSYTQQR